MGLSEQSRDMAASHAKTSFATLPAEIRNTVFQNAIPQRTLQMGFDFPYPCIADLGLPHTTIIYHICCKNEPVITHRLPTIFHLCRQSRAIALAVYIPFSYSYLHPIHDTLFISKQAAQCIDLDFSSESNHAISFYPLAALERLAIEYDPRFPDSNLHLASSVGNLIGQLGVPMKLWLVVNNSLRDQSPSYLKSHFKSYQELELKKMPSMDCEEQKLKRAKEALGVSCSGEEWAANWDDVEFELMELEKTDVIPSPFTCLSDERKKQLHDAPGRLLVEWKKEEFEMHGRDWNEDVDGAWNRRENVERLFARKGLPCPWKKN
jgi:hypothetical protein